MRLPRPAATYRRSPPLPPSHAHLPIIADPKVLFGTDTTMSQPANFFAEGASLATLDGTAQLLSSQTPSGFAAATLEIEAGETATMTIVYGHATSVEEFTGVIAPKLSTKGYISSKREAARQLVKDITKRVETTTASKRFDNYVTMNYLDNVLRGGLPVKLGDPANPRIYHTYVEDDAAAATATTARLLLGRATAAPAATALPAFYYYYYYYSTCTG